MKHLILSLFAIHFGYGLSRWTQVKKTTLRSTCKEVCRRLNTRLTQKRYHITEQSNCVWGLHAYRFIHKGNGILRTYGIQADVARPFEICSLVWARYKTVEHPVSLSGSPTSSANYKNFLQPRTIQACTRMWREFVIPKFRAQQKTWNFNINACHFHGSGQRGSKIVVLWLSFSEGLEWMDIYGYLW